MEGGLAPEFGLSNYRYRPGINYALTRNGERWSGHQYNKAHPFGIHVYLMEPGRRYHSWPWLRIIRVICHIDDLVRASRSQAVFTQVRITRAEYERAVRGGGR